MKVLSKQRVYTSSVYFKGLFLCQVPYFCFGIFLFDDHQDNCVQKKSGFNKSMFTEQKHFFFHHNEYQELTLNGGTVSPSITFQNTEGPFNVEYSVLPMQGRGGGIDTPCHFWKGGTSPCTAAFSCCTLRVGLSRVILAFICFSIFNIIKVIF